MSAGITVKICVHKKMHIRVMRLTRGHDFEAGLMILIYLTRTAVTFVALSIDRRVNTGQHADGRSARTHSVNVDQVDAVVTVKK